MLTQTVKFAKYIKPDKDKLAYYQSIINAGLVVVQVTNIEDIRILRIRRYWQNKFGENFSPTDLYVPYSGQIQMPYLNNAYCMVLKGEYELFKKLNFQKKTFTIPYELNLLSYSSLCKVKEPKSFKAGEQGTIEFRQFKILLSQVDTGYFVLPIEHFIEIIKYNYKKSL